MSLSTEQEKIASEFPEVNWSIAGHVCVFRPEGTLNSGMLARVVKWLQEIETDCAHPFHRFTDLTKLHTIEISRLDLSNLAFWRRTTYKGPVIKSAILAQSEEGLELAGAYQSFMEGSLILVSVFQSTHDAAAWLRVPAKLLEEAKPS
jgi:hypothetical protein